MSCVWQSADHRHTYPLLSLFLSLSLLSHLISQFVVGGFAQSDLGEHDLWCVILNGEWLKAVWPRISDKLLHCLQSQLSFLCQRLSMPVVKILNLGKMFTCGNSNIYLSLPPSLPLSPSSLFPSLPLSLFSLSLPPSLLPHTPFNVIAIRAVGLPLVVAASLKALQTSTMLCPSTTMACQPKASNRALYTSPLWPRAVASLCPSLQREGGREGGSGYRTVQHSELSCLLTSTIATRLSNW